MRDADEFYKPEIKPNVQIDGVALESASSGSKINVIQTGFVTSIQDDLPINFDTLLGPFYPKTLGSLNKALIIIKKEKTAKVYHNFPLALSANTRRDVVKGEDITEEDIFDIGKLEFRDNDYEVNIEKTDKIIFLFRIKWAFGLYFDFSGNIDVQKLKEDLGYQYKRLFYSELYHFIENKNYFETSIKDGWFPFIRLIGNSFNKVMTYYKEGKKHGFHIDGLIQIFTKEKIESFTKYWWKKSIFNDKKKVLEAGINSFLRNDDEGFINCISTLYPQIEGIMGSDYFKVHGSKPLFSELKNYIKQKGESKYNTLSSVAFPSEFYAYLDKTVFENFDLTTGNVDLSRHTVSHGYANANDFNKAKALQAILILDQIYFYL